MSVRILRGHVLDRLRELPDESVHCCVTSPPYYGLRDYGVPGQLGLEPTLQEYLDNMVAVFREVRRVLRSDGTLWLNIGDSYAANRGYQVPHGDIRGSEAARDAGAIGGRGMKAATDGFKPKDLMGVPWRLAFALQADGWYLRSEIIWHKKSCMPESVRDRPTKSHEHIFLLAKSESYYYDQVAASEPVTGDPEAARNEWNTKDYEIPGQKPQKRTTRTSGKNSTQPKQYSHHRIVENVARARESGADHDNPFGSTRNWRDVWSLGPEPFKEAHFATFPTEIPRRAIVAGCPVGGTVLDPFLGSGTTALVADRLQRDCIGIELNPAYADMAERRIRADSPLFSEVA